MIRHIAMLLALLLHGPLFAAEPDPRSPLDLFGKPRVHGEPVNKGFIGLSSGRTNLAFGQPLQVERFTVNPNSDGPPYLDVREDIPLELTDDSGKKVPYNFEVRSGGPNCLIYTLWPTKDHATGVYWKPGIYKVQLTVVISDEQPPAKHILTGRFRSNELVFTVRKPGAALDTWDGKGKLRSDSEGKTDAGVDLFLYVAGLDAESSERLRLTTRVGSNQPKPWDRTAWRVAAAEYAPVMVPQDRKLTEKEEKDLLANLQARDPAKRIQAVRSVPPTASAEVFAAAVKLLFDPYEQIGGPFSPSPTYPVSNIATDALCRLGLPAVPSLLEFAEKQAAPLNPFQQTPRQRVATLLGRIGPNPASAKYLRDAIASQDPDRLAAALVPLTAWGKAGVGLTREILALPKLNLETRRSAIGLIGKFGDVKTDAPGLRKLLNSTERILQQSAITALAALRDTDSLPAFEALARDRMADDQLRIPAMLAVLSLADTRTSDRLLRDLISEKADVNMRYEAIGHAGRRKVASALPLVLDALEDPELSTRLAADNALRQLADQGSGVGYDPKAANAKPWRDFWAKREKK